MSKNAKRRLLILIGILIVIIAVLFLLNIFGETMEPDAYEYYIEHAMDETHMANVVTAIYLQYRLFDTLFEALLLSVAVSAVVYFAAAWEKEEGEGENE